MFEIAPGLAESLADGDLVYATFLDTVDAYVKRRRMELPEDPTPARRSPTRLASPNRCDVSTSPRKASPR